MIIVLPDCGMQGSLNLELQICDKMIKITCVDRDDDVSVSVKVSRNDLENALKMLDVLNGTQNG
jgi:hypothetical protein